MKWKSRKKRTYRPNSKVQKVERPNPSDQIEGLEYSDLSPRVKDALAEIHKKNREQVAH